MASSTRRRFSGATALERFKTFETVPRLTPASAATSRIVTGRRFAGVSSGFFLADDPLTTTPRSLDEPAWPA
jgi:hypothetical protein